MINPMHIDLIMHVTDSLAELPKDMSEGILFSEMWSHVNSKYSNEFDLDVLTEATTDNGITCLVNLGGDVYVDFFNLKARHYRIPSLQNKNQEYKNFERFDIKEGDVFMFPSHTEHKIIGDGAKYINFKVDHKKAIGSGKDKYRVEMTFSDTYYVIVNADSEEEARDIAYDINVSNFIHEWPEDPELDRIQSTRMTKWGKKMLKARKV